MKTNSRSLSAALALCVVALIPACKGQDSAAKPAAVKEAPKAAAGGAGADAELAGPCGDLVKKLCAEAGESGEVCTSAQQLSKVLPDSSCSAAVKDFASVQAKLKAARKVCDDVVARFCKELGEQTETCKFVREETAKFPTNRCEQVNKDFDKHLTQLKAREAMRQPLSTELQAKIAAPDAPSFGPESAKVTVVEFSDFQCPYCSKAADVMSQLKTKYKGQDVRIVFRQFPLNFHQQAHLAAQASLAANKQGKFWEFHDALFKNQRTLERADLEKFAKEVGVNLGELKTALDSSAFKAQVDADLELGKQVNVSGTPTLFVNGKRVPNATDLAAVSQAIDEALGS